jgi:hypothetical protein
LNLRRLVIRGSGFHLPHPATMTAVVRPTAMPPGQGFDGHQAAEFASPMATLISVLGGLALIAVVLGGSQFLGPHGAKYTITENSIELNIFGKFRVWRTSFQDISDIQIISFSNVLTTSRFGLSLMNRPFARRYVLVRRRRGIFRNVLITPDRPEELVKMVREKMTKSPNTDR